MFTPFGVTLRSAAVGIAVLVCIGCTSGEPEPQPVTLAALATDQQQLDGTFVVTDGTVRDHDDPLHYWIEDGQQNRVELLPHADVEDLVGHDVRVTGAFSYADDRGRVITIDDLEVLREPPGA